jgi:ABC-type polar amino acid transport system ATPase subunit
LVSGPLPAAVLVADSVTVRYGETAALSGVSLAVADGECVAFCGESGSGKTTLLRCFNRLVTPDAGRVLLLAPFSAAAKAFAILLPFQKIMLAVMLCSMHLQRLMKNNWWNCR